MFKSADLICPSSFFFKQNSVAVFRELCGVSAVANLMQCVLALSSRVSGPDGTPLVLFDLRDHYPTLEPQGPLPDVLRRVVSTYEMVRREETKQLICFLPCMYKRLYMVLNSGIHQKEGKTKQKQKRSWISRQPPISCALDLTMKIPLPDKSFPFYLICPQTQSELSLLCSRQHPLLV